MPSNDKRRSQQHLELETDWSPAYELFLSMGALCVRKLHPLLELGPDWLHDVRQRMPHAFSTRVNEIMKSKGSEDDVFYVLVHASPVRRDVSQFLEWFAKLSAGDAYESVCPLLPESGPTLPRDFPSWRDRLLDLLTTWNEIYFNTVDPALLHGLEQEAASLRKRFGAVSPRDLVEEVTNGIRPEADIHRAVLVPQYHHRPYNTHANIEGGAIMLYPADVMPAAPDGAPLALLRLTRGLSDESRLRMLRFLAGGPCTLTEVARFAGLSQPTVHHHLTQLRAAGLVRVHFFLSGPSRYSLRPNALDMLSEQLGAYLAPEKGVTP